MSASALAEPCEDPRDAVDDAGTALLQMDTESAWSALERAEQRLRCGPAPSPETLARFWLVEGGLLHFERDAEGAAASFRAAGRADPTVWLVDLGPDLLAASEAARAAAPSAGELALDPIDPRYRVLLDLRPTPLPAIVEAGPHLLQILLDDEVRHGLIVVVLPDRRTVIESHLPAVFDQATPAPAPIAPVAAPPVERRTAGLFAWGAGGLGLGLGERLERRTVGGSTVIEPSVRLSTMVEGGLALRTGPVWTRASVGLAPQLGGRLLWVDDAGIRETPVASAAGLAAGVAVGALDLGLQAGVVLPSRSLLGAVGSWQIGQGPGCVEARVGATLIHDRAPEPSFAVLGAVCPESR